MTDRSDRPILSRPELVGALSEAWVASADGPHQVLLDGPRGSGRRTALGLAAESFAEGEGAAAPCVVRIRFQEADDGVRCLMRVFGAFVASLGRGVGFDSKPADLLEEAANTSGDARITSWLQTLSKNVREMSVHQGGGDFRIELPQSNPYLGLLYAIDVLAPRARWLIELSEVGTCTSPGFWTFLAALLGRARSRNWKMLVVASAGPNLYGESHDKAGPQAGPQTFLSALFEGAEVIPVPALAVSAIEELLEGSYRPNSFPDELGTRLHSLSGGRPEVLHEILDALEEDETITWDESGYALSDLEEVAFEVLVPMVLEGEGDESDEDEEPEEGLEEKFEKILHVASFEGQVFSASAIRSVLGTDEDTVDDALDAMEHIVREGEYNEALGTWTYRFRYDFYRKWFRDNPPEDFGSKEKEIGRALGTVMLQAYAPAAFTYVSRAARLLSEAGDNSGARNLLGMAMGSERIELMDFALEILERFEDTVWPPMLERFLHGSLADRFTNGASPEEAEKRIEAFRAWAERAEDEESLAYTRLLACRLEIRKGDFSAARKAGEEALASFENAGASTRAGETLNQLAMISLNMGDAKGAQGYVKRAQKATNIPPVKAHSQYILGLMLKRDGQVPQASSCFGGAARLATESGQLGLALEAMLNHGECGVMLGQAKELAPMLERALEMSRAMRSMPRERVAARLLCQAEAARGNAEAAFEMARHALELSREIEPEGREALDLYHCGLFAVLSGKKDEGLDFLATARAACEEDDNQPLLAEILFNLGQVRLSMKEWPAARTALERALGIVRELKQKPRELRILEALGIALSGAGDHRGAMDRFEEASKKAVGPQAKDFRKSLRQRIAQEQSRANQA